MLEDKDLFERNMRALEKYPKLIKKIKTASADVLEVSAAKNGMPTLRIKTADKEAYIHSSYDPSKEANRWVQSLELKGQDILVILGFGLGYHALELAKNVPEDVKIIIVEPHIGIFKAALRNIDLSKFISADNTFFILGEDYSALRQAIRRVINIYRIDKIKVLEYRPLTKTFSQDYKGYYQFLHDEILAHYSTSSTVVNFAFKWTRNLLSNLDEFIGSQGVAALFDKFKGKPAILVSAGPSLKKNMHLLKEAKNKALILCVGGIFKVLLKEGIIPDLVISVDGDDFNHRLFQGLPEHNVPLLFDPSVNSLILKEYSAPKFAFLCNEVFFKLMGYLVKDKKGFVEIGPSVANIGLDVLVRLGCNPIVFVGQDLAYEGETSHCEGTEHDEYNKKRNWKPRKYEVEGIKGGKVVTDKPLYVFLKWFENYIAIHKDVNFINATEGGANIPGTKAMALKEVLGRYCLGEVEAGKIIAETLSDFKEPGRDEYVDIINKIKSAKEQVEKMKDLSRRGIERSRELAKIYGKGERFNWEVAEKIFNELDSLDQELKENQEISNFANLLFQPVFRLLHHITLPAFTEETELEKGKRVVQQGMVLYCGINDGASTIEKLLEEALGNFEDRLSKKGATQCKS